LTLSRRARVDARPNLLAAELDQRSRAGRPHLDLTVSNPTRVGLPYDREGIARALTPRDALLYEPAPFGLDVARTAVAELWRSRGIAVDPSRVALTASTSEAYSFLFKLLADHGDAILVPQPSYPLFEHLARYEGIEAVPYPLDYDGAWHLDPTRVARAITARTRALVVVSPNNPTGSYLKREELAGLAKLGLPIISDEVFGFYALREDPRRATSALEVDGTLVFALDGLSKLAMLPQMKLAWITIGGPESVVSEAMASLEHITDAFLSPAAPVQHALGSLIGLTRPTREAARARLEANYRTLLEASAQTPVTPLPVEGGWYAVARLPAVQSEEAWVLGLLDAHDVLVQPGWFYDFPEEPFVVLSLLTEPSEFREGVRRLADYATSLR
jgi:aspartate/methionine/tyrosine aminotransferase